jgi:putative selenate reductase FAD-binding subunit
MIQEILRPLSVREALQAKSRPHAAYLGGGTWLNSHYSSEPWILISLENLGLGTIELAGDRCTIGATINLQQMIDATLLPSGLRAAASLTGSRTLRNMRTIGGELGLCPDDSALIPALIALNADVALAGRKKPRPVEELCNGRTGPRMSPGATAGMSPGATAGMSQGATARMSPGATAGMSPGATANELILSISVPRAQCEVKAICRTSHSPRSLVVAVSAGAITPKVAGIRVIVSDCRGQRGRLGEVERALEGAPLPPKKLIEEAVGRAFAPKADLHASVEYKRYLAGVLVADALSALAERERAP